MKKYSVRGVRDVGALAVNLCPAHIRFVGVRWENLKTYLDRRFGADGRVISEEARRRAEISLRRATRFLSRKGVPNVHRFVRPLRMNRGVQIAMRGWAERFWWDEEAWVMNK